MEFSILRNKNKLPPWLTYQVINNILIFSGTPTKLTKANLLSPFLMKVVSLIEERENNNEKTINFYSS